MDTSLILNFAAALLATGLLGFCWWLHIRQWLASRQLPSGQDHPPETLSYAKPQNRSNDFVLRNTARWLEPRDNFKQRYLTLSVLDTTGEYADLAFDSKPPDKRNCV